MCSGFDLCYAGNKIGRGNLCFGVGLAACIAVFLCRRGNYQELLRFLCQGMLSVVVFLLSSN